MSETLKHHLYAIFSSKSGWLVGNLVWRDAVGIYSSDPHSVRAFHLLNNKPQLRWIDSQLDANAQENDQEITRLNIIRRATGLGSLCASLYRSNDR